VASAMNAPVHSQATCELDHFLFTFSIILLMLLCPLILFDEGVCFVSRQALHLTDTDAFTEVVHS
jgi:hypothetical protein